ncbi:hypothetical protein PROFUN_01183 [Planoprotostelium fungivorum]|uniref:Uncharacterized protein n=1 Tax=Planoprotostelium fungivorum TaxID=1890364 RepID=A0A2P6NCI6_9EUKA|nr:hypothetical protein PROFUN_01183 [Planoprotostelium fungivorum]
MRMELDMRTFNDASFRKLINERLDMCLRNAPYSNFTIIERYGQYHEIDERSEAEYCIISDLWSVGLDVTSISIVPRDKPQEKRRFAIISDPPKPHTMPTIPPPLPPGKPAENPAKVQVTSETSSRARDSQVTGASTMGSISSGKEEKVTELADNTFNKRHARNDTKVQPHQQATKTETTLINKPTLRKTTVVQPKQMPYKRDTSASSVVRLHILEIETRLKTEQKGFDTTTVSSGKKWSKPEKERERERERETQRSPKWKRPSPAEEQSQLARMMESDDDASTRMEEIGKLLEVARQSSYLLESEPSSTASSVSSSPIMERRTTIEMVMHRDSPSSVNCSPATRHVTKAMRAVEMDSYKEQFERMRSRLVAAKEKTQRENMQLVEKIQEQVTEEQRQRRKQRVEAQRREDKQREKECEDIRKRTQETRLNSAKSQQQIEKMNEEADATRRRRRMEEIKKEEERKKERVHRRKMRDMVRVLEEEYEELKQAQQSAAYYRRM